MSEQLPAPPIDPELQHKIYDDCKNIISKSGPKLQTALNGLLLDWIELGGLYGQYKANVFKRRLEKLIQKTRLESMQEDEVSESIHSQISGPIITNMQFVDEGGILESMYINILVKALIQKNISKIHPAYAVKIQQLSPDEAIILYHLKKGLLVEGSITYVCNKGGGWKDIENYEFDFSDLNLKYPENAYMYIKHLESLELIEAPEIERENNSNLDVETRQITRTTKASYNIRFTEFAKYMAEICIPDEIDIDGYIIAVKDEKKRA